MATRLLSLKRLPGAEGPVRTTTRRISALLWGTNLRRTLTALALVLAAVAIYFLVFRRSAVRLLQVGVILSIFLVILSKPHAGVIALRISRAFQQGLRVESIFRGLGVTLVKSLGLFTLIAFIALVVAKRIKPVFGHKTQLIFFYGLLFANLISAFAAYRWKDVGTQIFQMAQNLILYTIFVNLFAEAKWLSRFLWFSVISILVACATALLSVPLGGVVRAAGSLGNANGMAMVANEIAAILLVFALADPEAKKKMLYWGGLALALITIIFTGSRGGLLTVIITFAYQLIKRRKDLTPYFVATLLLIAAFVIIPEKYKIRQEEWFGAMFAGETKEVTGGSRGFIYRSALDIFKRSPIIGIGPRTFGYVYQEEYASEVRGPVSHVKVAHSGLLEVLAETGLLGFSLFVGLIISTYSIYRANGRRCRQANLGRYLLLNEAFEAWFIAVIVAGSFETILKGNSFFLGLAAAASIHRASVKLAAAAPEQPETAPALLPQTAHG